MRLLRTFFGSEFTRRYVLALALVGLLSTFATAGLLIVTSLQQNYIRNVQISARQQMLAQRIARYALQYVDAQTNNDELVARAQLQESIYVFRDSHLALINGGSAPSFKSEQPVAVTPITSAEINALLFSAPTELDKQVQDYLTNAELLLNSSQVDREKNYKNPNLIYLLSESQDRLQISLTDLSDAYENEAYLQIQFLTYVEVTVLVVILLVLALEGMYLFRPMLDQMNSRQLELQESNAQLESTNRRIAERARDLEVAAKVGGIMSSFRNLDELLQQAVDLIRKEFDLYYAQIYLTDATGRSLTLQAGTGAVGQELVQRGHRLAIGLESINGLAALEKRPVVVANTKESPLFRPNPLLPETRSEISVPLLSNDRVLGVLDLQNDKPNSLTPDLIPAFQILVSQLAVAIENANLFTQVTQTQADFEAQARRLARQNWQTYLGNSDTPSRFRYTYNLEGGTSDSATTIHNVTYNTPIRVVNEEIGVIEIEGVSGQKWNDEDAKLVQAVAEQVAQQIENLRLLEDAERYRLEAETALRRLTRQSWENYLEELEEPLEGFTFDGNDVTPLFESVKLADASLTTTLEVRGETVGRLEIVADELTSEADILVSAIATRLSTHLENLRLTEQMEHALAQTESLYYGSDRVIKANSIQAILEGLTGTTALANLGRNEIVIFAHSWDTVKPEFMTIVAEVGPGEWLNTRLPLAYFLGNRPFQPDQPTLFHNLTHTVHIEESWSKTLIQAGWQSIMAIPLISAGSWFGLVLSYDAEEIDLTTEEMRQITSLSEQAASAIQNLRLIEQTRRALAETERRSEELAIINRIVTAVAAETNLEKSLQIIVDESASALDIEQVRIALFNTSRDALEIKAERYNPAKTQSAKGFKIPVAGNKLMELVQKSRRTIVINNAQQAPETENIHSALKEQKVETLIVMPIVAGGQIIGTVGIDLFEYGDKLTDEQLRLAETIVLQAGTAIQNANLIEQTKRRAEELAAINQVAQAVATLLDIQQLLATVYVQIQRILPVDTFFVALKTANPDAHVVEFPLFVAHGNAYPMGETVLPEESYTYKVLQNGEPLIQHEAPEKVVVITDEHRENDDTLEVTTVDRAQTRFEQSALFAPLTSGREVIGVMSIQSFERHAYTDDYLTLFIGIANFFAVALQNARLFTETQRRAERERMVNEIAQKIQGTATVDRALQVTIQELGKALKARYTKVAITPPKAD